MFSRSLTATVEFLWREPHKLFAAYFDSIGEDRIKAALV
jgi:hypothetical protein